MNVRSISGSRDVSFWQLTRLNDILDALASPETERASKLLGSNYEIGPSIDLIASVYSPALSYAPKLKQTFNYLLDLAYRRDPEDVIENLIPKAACENPHSPISFIPDIMEKYLARYKAKFGEAKMIRLINKIERYNMFEGSSSFPKLTACIVPIRAECHAKTQTLAEQFLTYSSIARFGVDPDMSSFREEFRDMDSHNKLRNYGLSKSLELLPSLESNLTDSAQCFAIIKAIAHFFFAKDPNVDGVQQKQLSGILGKAWTGYFDMGGNATSIYKDLRLEGYHEFPRNALLATIEDLADRLAKEGEIQPSLTLRWTLSHSHPIGSAEQRAVLHQVNQTIIASAQAPQNDEWLYKFSERTLRGITGITDMIPRSAIAWLAHGSHSPDEVLPPDAASPVPSLLTPVARTMMGIMEKHADQLLGANPEAAAQLFFLLSRFNVRGQEEQQRLASKTVNAYDSWLAQSANPNGMISHIADQLKTVDALHPVAVALKGFRDAHLVNPIKDLHDQVAAKLERVIRRTPVKRANLGEPSGAL